MWTISGPLNAAEADVENSEPASSTHFLRPDREYRLGRMSYSSVNAATGKSTKAKAHLLDFQLKNGAVPKEGLFTISTGKWTQEMATDNPASPTNLDPYSLKINSAKPLIRLQPDGTPGEHLEKDTDHFLHDGNTIQSIRNLHFTVNWVPVVACFANVTAAGKPGLIQQAQQAAIKVAFRTFLPHHTHFITKALEPTFNLVLASMHTSKICAPNWIDQLAICVMAPPRSAECPDIPARGKIEGDLEKAILAVDSKAGYDVRRYWTHSILELDWSQLPSPTDPKVACAPGSKDPTSNYTTASWNANLRRKTLFEGIVFISFRGIAESDTNDAVIVRAGGGKFMACDLLRPGASAQSILAVVEDFKEAEDISPDARFVITPPAANDDPKMSNVLREVANALGVSTYATEFALTDAVADVNTSSLFEGDLIPPSQNTGGSSGHIFVPGTAPPPTASAQQSLSSSFNSIAGTHPEENTLLAGGRVSRSAAPPANQGSTDAGPSGVAQPPAAPPTVRKLTRRTKTTQPSPFNMFGPATVQTQSVVPYTQVAAPTLNLDNTVSDMDIDTSYVAPPPKKVLKRRGPSQATDSSRSIFDFEVATTSSSSRPAKKPRTEDDDASDEDGGSSAHAKTQANKGCATQLSAVAEEGSDDDAPGPSAQRKKRAATGSDDDDASTTAPAARKKRRGTSEEPAPAPAPVVVVPAKTPKKVVPASPTTVKGKKMTAAATAAAAKKAAKAEEAASGILRFATIRRKGGEIDQGFNDDFNALKIVKPALQPMTTQKGRRLEWEEQDEDEEVDRLIREDQDREEHPDEWGGRVREQGMFVVEHVSMVRKDRPAPKEVVPDGKYAGRPNFKKFRSKTSALDGPRAPVPKRAPIILKLSETADFGLGDAYKEKPKARKRFSKAALVEEDDEDDFEEESSSTQTKLNFKKAAPAKPKASAAKGKGKGKAADIVLDSDDDSNDDAKLDTMDVDDSDTDVSQTLTSKKGKAPAAKKAPAASTSKAKAPAKKAPARAKKAPSTMMIDDDDDDESDDGLTFKGFGKKRKR